jgi:hypothetical protein
MPERRCLSCSRGFDPRPQAPDQQYCSEKVCQRERRRRWQREKKRSDADYRDNQRNAQQAWAEAHGGYWCEWRVGHPEYCERNRAQQRLRNQRRQASVIAKMDASTASEADLGVPSGIYRLMPEPGGKIAKMDAWTVRIAVISKSSGDGGGNGGVIAKKYSIGGDAGGG